MTITGRVDGAELAAAHLQGLAPETAERARAACVAAADDVAARLRADLPRQFRDDIRVDVQPSASGVRVGIYLAGRRAGAWVQGFDGMVDVRAYLRTVHVVWGVPVDPIREHVRAHRRHYHSPAHPQAAATASAAAASLEAALAGVLDGME